jgi:DNA-3-methyladenine glycosylase
MFMPPGTAYVYTIYGTHQCFNISSNGEGAAVLIRAAEPLEGLDIMRQRRGTKRKDGGAGIKDYELCSGPANLCQAMDITKEMFNGRDLTAPTSGLWLEASADSAADWTVSAPRIGIDYAGIDWASKPLRFYLYNSKSVSVRNREADRAVLSYC